MPRTMSEANKGIVEIEVTDHYAVGENRQIGARFDAAAQDRRAWLCSDVASQLDRNFTRSRSVAAERAAGRVEDRAFGYAHDLLSQVLVFQVDRIASKRVGQGNLTAAESRPARLGLILRYHWNCPRACDDTGSCNLLEKPAPLFAERQFSARSSGHALLRSEIAVHVIRRRVSRVIANRGRFEPVTATGDASSPSPPCPGKWPISDRLS